MSKAKKQAVVAIPAKAPKTAQTREEFDAALARIDAMQAPFKAEQLNKAVAEVLAEWHEWAGWQGDDARTCRQIARGHRSLKTVPAGSFVRPWEGGKTVQVVEQFEGSSTKVKEADGKITTWAPAAEVEIVPPSEVSQVARVVTQGDGTTATIKTETTAKKNKIDVFGFSHTKFFMWAGSKGWAMEDCQKALAGLGLPVVSELSIKCFLRAGKSDEVRIREKRGDLPTYSRDQENMLAEAAGKEPIHAVQLVIVPAVEAKPAKKVTAKQVKKSGK